MPEKQYIFKLNATNTFNLNTWLVKLVELLIQKLPKPQLSNKAWLRLKEVGKFFKLTVWIYSVQQHEWAFRILRDRIIKISRPLFYSGGANMHSFLYLKECVRLVIVYLAGTPDHGFVLGRIMVRKDRWGLPVIIPKYLRIFLRLYFVYISNKSIFHLEYKGINNVITCILSLLSIYRIFPTKPLPSLDTITGPFTGIWKSIDSAMLVRAMKEIPLKFFKLEAPKLLLIESAGPNGFKSTWTCALDVIAFILNPMLLFSYITYAYKVHRASWLVIWIVFLCLVMIPWIIFYGFGSIVIGRLSVVLDQAGKARIIAICSWWIQVIFKPLHDAIFKVLRKIPQDGTFDQIAPVNLLIQSQTRGETFYSYDLSAATDRLPIDLQRDILNLCMPNLGTLWYNILVKIEYLFGKALIKYSVGQPMGAFSSWGMLALTHHICVHVAALRVGISHFKDYAILGDDVVIANDLVAGCYLELMTNLGVSINLSKSLCSSLFLEFAKRWVGPGIDLTPIAPGLILRTIRMKIYISKLITEALKLNIIPTLSEALSMMSRLPSFYRGQLNNTLWAVCGPLLTLTKGSHADFGKIAWCFSFHENELLKFKFLLYKALYELHTEMLNANKAELEASLVFFENNFWKSNLTSKTLTRVIESVGRIISPAYWTYVHVLTVNLILIQERIDVIPNYINFDLDKAIASLLKAIGPLNVATIDWREKRKIRETVTFALRLKFIIQWKISVEDYFNKFWVPEPREMPLPGQKLSPKKDNFLFPEWEPRKVRPSKPDDMFSTNIPKTDPRYNYDSPKTVGPAIKEVPLSDIDPVTGRMKNWDGKFF